MIQMRGRQPTVGVVEMVDEVSRPLRLMGQKRSQQYVDASTLTVSNPSTTSR